jgi:hypothetical protein
MLIGCVCSRSQAPEDFLEPGPDVRAPVGVSDWSRGRAYVAEPPQALLRELLPQNARPTESHRSIVG